MAQEEKAKTILAKAKKKKWYKILAPKIFNEQLIGQTPAYEIKSLVGKTLEANLYTLTKNIKNQNTDIKLRITHFREDSACTEVICYKVNPSSMRRFVKKTSNKIEDSFSSKTEDNLNVRVKTTVFTRGFIRSNVSKALRKATHELVLKNVEKSRFDTLIRELSIHKFQNTIKNDINKIYPVRIFEVTTLLLVPESKMSTKKKQEKTSEPKKIEQPKEEQKVEQQQ